VWVDDITILDPSRLVTMHDDCVLKVPYDNEDSGNSRNKLRATYVPKGARVQIHLVTISVDGCS
jgi:hypothetical protein